MSFLSRGKGKQRNRLNLARLGAATRLSSLWPPRFKDLNQEGTERLSELRVQFSLATETAESRLVGETNRVHFFRIQPEALDTCVLSPGSL